MNSSPNMQNHAPIHLSGDLCVCGRAAPLVKCRIRHLREGRTDWAAFNIETDPLTTLSPICVLLRPVVSYVFV